MIDDADVRDGMRILWDRTIPMAEGFLKADIYLPGDGEGPFPVVAAMTAYGKSLPFSLGYAEAWKTTVRDSPGMLDETTTKYISFEAPDPEKWTPHGYAVAVIDSRGCGRSPGVINSFSGQEASDYAAAIDWIGSQDWCTGKVGTLGMSYLAVSQWLMASRRPKHLAGIIPWEGFDDSLRQVGYHNGIPSSFMKAWYDSQIKSVQNGLGDRGFRNPYTGVLVSGDENLTEAELEANWRATDIYEQHMSHPLDDGFYDDRRAVWANIDMPVFAVASWGNVGVHLRGCVEGFVNAASEHKWLWLRRSDTFSGLYSDEGVAMQRRFFDWALKGTGDWATSQPPILLGVRSATDQLTFRAEQHWPLDDTVWTRLYLDLANEALSWDEATEEGAMTYRGFGDGLNVRTKPFERESEITGPLSAKLWISSSTVDADLFLMLRLFDPSGVEVLFQGNADPKQPITAGWQRASRRELDPERSLEYRPYLALKREQPLEPGEVYEVDVEVWPTSLIVPQGYSLGLSIWGKDFDHGQEGVPFGKLGAEMRGSSVWLHTDPKYRPADIYDGEVTVYSGPDRPSSLLVPVIQRD